VVKRLLQEDVNQISPTVGFHIETLEYRGYDHAQHKWLGIAVLTPTR